MKSTFPLALLTTAFLTTLGQAATIVGTATYTGKRGQEEICSIARFSRSQSTEEKVFSGRLEQDRMRL